MKERHVRKYESAYIILCHHVLRRRQLLLCSFFRAQGLLLALTSLLLADLSVVELETSSSQGVSISHKLLASRCLIQIVAVNLPWLLCDELAVWLTTA